MSQWTENAFEGGSHRIRCGAYVTGVLSASSHEIQPMRWLLISRKLLLVWVSDGTKRSAEDDPHREHALTPEHFMTIAALN